MRRLVGMARGMFLLKRRNRKQSREPPRKVEEILGDISSVKHHQRALVPTQERGNPRWAALRRGPRETAVQGSQLERRASDTGVPTQERGYEQASSRREG